MTNIQRKILLSFFVLIFLITAPLLILHFQGIKFDFKKGRFVFSGAIYLKAKPQKASVFLNGNFVGETDPIFGSIQIKNLIPKEYEIEVKKEGFFPWRKELKVEEKRVTEVLGLILFPQRINFRKINLERENFENLKKKEGISCQEILKSLEIRTNEISQKECLAQKIGEKIFLFLNNNLYEFSTEKEGFEKIFEGVKTFEKKEDKIAILLDHEIWLLDKEGKKFLVRETQKIKDIAFLTKNYLVFLTEKKIKIVETDTRDKINVYEMAEIEGNEVATTQKGEILLKSDEGFLISDPLY